MTLKQLKEMLDRAKRNSKVLRDAKRRLERQKLQVEREWLLECARVRELEGKVFQASHTSKMNACPDYYCLSRDACYHSKVHRMNSDCGDRYSDCPICTKVK